LTNLSLLKTLFILIILVIDNYKGVRHLYQFLEKLNGHKRYKTNHEKMSMEFIPIIWKNKSIIKWSQKIRN
jgi:hypothetical protein